MSGLTVVDVVVVVVDVVVGAGRPESENNGPEMECVMLTSMSRDSTELIL